MRKMMLFAVTVTLAITAFGQDNFGSISQSSQSSSESTSASASTSSDFGSTSANDPPENQSSAEMIKWEKSNSRSRSSSTTSNNRFSIGFDRDNDENDDDQPSWSKSRASRPSPEQIDGTYRISTKSGPFLCTVRLTSSPYFNGYFAVTSAGCPELWKVTRWDFDGRALVLTSSMGDVYATFWPRGRSVWVGSASATGQRLSLSR